MVYPSILARNRMSVHVLLPIGTLGILILCGMRVSI